MSFRPLDAAALRPAACQRSKWQASGTGTQPVCSRRPDLGGHGHGARSCLEASTVLERNSRTKPPSRAKNVDVLRLTVVVREEGAATSAVELRYSSARATPRLR